MRIFSKLAFAACLSILGGCGTAPVKTASGMPSGWIDRQNRDFSGIADSTVSPKGVQVYLGGDLLFKLGRSKLTADGVQKVDSLAMVLKKYPQDQVTVLVFTDNSGKASRNLRLTQRRADLIKAELLKQGVPAESVLAVGKGETQPVAPNDTGEGRAKNRRAEFDITKS